MSKKEIIGVLLMVFAFGVFVGVVIQRTIMDRRLNAAQAQAEEYRKGWESSQAQMERCLQQTDLLFEYLEGAKR